MTILHCYFCALGGDHRTKSSEVAIVEGLAKPLKANMFKPLHPEHDKTPPFMTDEWRYMYHRACGKYPWPYDVDPYTGPSRILTDEGFVDIPDEPAATVLDCTCEVCGKVCKSPQGLKVHKHSCKGGVK